MLLLRLLVLNQGVVILLSHSKKAGSIPKQINKSEIRNIIEYKQFLEDYKDRRNLLKEIKDELAI